MTKSLARFGFVLLILLGTSLSLSGHRGQIISEVVAASPYSWSDDRCDSNAQDYRRWATSGAYHCYNNGPSGTMAADDSYVTASAKMAYTTSFCDWPLLCNGSIGTPWYGEDSRPYFKVTGTDAVGVPIASGGPRCELGATTTFSTHTEAIMSDGPTCVDDYCAAQYGDIASCESDPYTHWDYNTCHCAQDPTPIVLDLEDRGFKFTSIGHGVTFDINADGIPDRTAWTDAYSMDAFLVLDRNGDGVINDASELFGNFTDQPLVPGRNGFLALAQFDQFSRGGNMDGQITTQDAIFRNLRLWVDGNHDGQSQAMELLTLDEYHVESVELNYRESRRTDSFGNQFRYVSKFTYRGPRNGSRERKSIDVIFQASLGGSRPPGKSGTKLPPKR